jgi:hypothetical protein
MRIVVILLLLANLALFALTRFEASPAGEAQRLSEQVLPEKLKLLTPQQFAALGPAKVASLSDVCVEWGPLSEPERARAMSELASLSLGPLVSTRRVDASGYAVTLGGFPSQAAAERRVAELKSRGFTDVAVLDLGKGQYAVSLGVFRTEATANGRADAVAQQGFTGARVAPRTGGVQQAMLVLRDPPQPAVARLREIAPTYAGTEIRVGGCERTS